MFLAIRPKQSRLSDLNSDLINTFRFVRDAPTLVSRYLHAHARRDSSEHFYAVREQYNSAPEYSAAQAARFIYLNRTCFNGIFRVTRSGQFNVPYGRYEQALLPTRTHLDNVSGALARARLDAAAYDRALRHANKGDFVYLDPPYPPLNGTSFFRHYTPDRFGEADQRQVFEHFVDLDRRGCLLMMSNADTPLIRGLYCAFKITALPATRWISCKNKKHAVTELVITNYNQSGNGAR